MHVKFMYYKTLSRIVVNSYISEPSSASRFEERYNLLKTC